MLRLNQVSAEVSGKMLLSPLSVTLDTPCCVGIIGANGAGKSTLLKTIGQNIAYQGEVLWQNQPLAALSEPQRAACMAFMPQHSQMAFALSVQEIVEMGVMMHPQLKNKNAVVHQAMAQFEITELKAQNYLHLSGGEKQRVHAARVWAQIQATDVPKLVLLDEPTSALDLKHQHFFLQHTQQLAQKHIVLIVLHDLNLVSRYCDKLLLLRRGELINFGDTKTLMTAQTIHALYDYHAEVFEHNNRIHIS
ncbi:ATP-binding cassette domain-containing protein [Pasteurellaceae bacterium HPA106]|uniref:ATP-binding cassette domain-containing protein n=1 Tax=Spirabiliibacterium pneumoniae TaxID=221400 RepID=UPI001AAD4A9B|nr:ATP-binding cassette domain-containing protein [Spirabiliibacterium pneumoniae]MBE2895662.1 ATP-binding cassette domain-containing protein [Spirabiliibacterium pneumoniae]